MKNILLINVAESDVKYVRSIFPDGETHIKFTTDIDRKEQYKVVCRITNPTELFELMQVGNILNRLGVYWVLEIPYLMGMRMDRVISFNEAFSLEIIANVINSLNIPEVGIYHPHSPRTLQLINNSYELKDNFNYLFKKELSDSIICFPDQGAYDRYYSTLQYYNPCSSYYITMNKVRDLENDGKIIKLEPKHIPSAIEWIDDILVYDDLCDGGGTFILTAKALREINPNAQLTIFVRHLVNPRGLENLSQNYDYVIITNSYKNWGDEENLPSNVQVLNAVDNFIK